MNFIIAKQENLNEIINLVQERIEWFSMKGIKMWSNFLINHPISEWLESINKHELYIATDNTKKILGCIELKFSDNLWNDSEKAIYIHKLCVAINTRNVGHFLLDNAKLVAQNRNVNKLRLDCLYDNKKLNDIYESYGFNLVTDAWHPHIKGYHYNLRELNIL